MLSLLSTYVISDFFSVNNVILIVILIIYELGYKILVIDKIKWSVQKTILKEQTDIVESTKSFYVEKLEEIKAININETETLKHNLNALLSLQLQHKSEERLALINFLSNCNQWIFNLSKIKFKKYYLTNIDELKLKLENIRDEYFLNIHTERIKIILFISNEQVNNSTYQLVEQIEKYKIDMENILSEYLELLKEQYNSRYEYEDIFEDIGAAIVTAYSIDNTDKIQKLFIDFENFNGPSFKRCVVQIENVAKQAKNYLNSLGFNK